VGRKEIGQRGEDIAVDYLRSQGWRILARNWRCSNGELDVVARDPWGVVVFCEVKTRRSTAFCEPLEAITVKKLRKLRELAGRWLRQQPRYIGRFRFDGIGIVLPSGRPAQITHKRGLGL
jgi:putative endonuclease